MNLSYLSPRGVFRGVFIFNEDVLNIFKKYQQNHNRDKEAGGQLFCQMKPGKVIIAQATEPDYLSKRSRFSFQPSRKSEQQAIDTHFNNGLHYIGDWHTHPEDIPCPSNEDIQKITDIFQKSTHTLTEIILLIVGRQPFPDGLWCGSANETGVVELKAC